MPSKQGRLYLNTIVSHLGMEGGLTNSNVKKFQMAFNKYREGMGYKKGDPRAMIPVTGMYDKRTINSVRWWKKYDEGESYKEEQRETQSKIDKGRKQYIEDNIIERFKKKDY